MFDSFEVEMIDNVPVIDEDGIMAYTTMLDNTSTAQARWFGNCMFFVCNISRELTKVKYAVYHNGSFVSAKVLRKMEKAKAKEQLKITKLTAKREKMEAKSREERRTIQEKFEQVKELLKVRVSNSKYFGMGEHFMTKRKEGVPFKTGKEIMDSVNARLETREREYSVKDRANDVMSKLGNIDVTQFFDQTKFKEYLQTPHGQETLAKYRESET